MGKLAADVATQQKVEILTALKKLGESLRADEEAFLEANFNAGLKEFERVSAHIGKTRRLFACVLCRYKEFQLSDHFFGESLHIVTYIYKTTP